MSDRVTIQISDGVADVRLNRPDKVNALDHAMFVALTEAGLRIADDTTVRAVVLSGEGRGFCAGLDFASFLELASGTDGEAAGQAINELMAPQDDSPANFAQRCAWVWQELPVPVIAAVHGVAFGGGLQIAAAADIRYVAPDAKLSVMEIRWGLIPDMSGTQTLRHLLRLDVLKELTFTGRIVDGTEAATLGLATHLSDTPREDALVAARDIAGRSPDAIRAAKRLLNQIVVGSTEQGLRLEAEIQATIMGRPNQVEAVMANVEKREPRFHDPD
jgi:enoyl-CoA hydratase/carnithine racemase